MKEPRPEQVVPPTVEPTLRVGIALPEDNRKLLTIRATSVPYRISAQDVEVLLPPGVPWSVALASQGLEVRNEMGKLVLATDAPLGVAPCTPARLAPAQGLALEPLVAGRTFHWRKEVAQILPGRFLFYPLSTNWPPSSEGASSSGRSLEGSQGMVVVNEVPFEEYCSCVIAAEMGAECPAPFMRAQVTAARSWGYVFLRNKHPGALFQICNDDDCQRYQGTTFLSQSVLDGVESARGYFLLDAQRFVLPAYYSKSCGGHSEPPLGVFGFEVPGIDGILDAAMASPSALGNEREFEQWLSMSHSAHDNPYCSSDSVPEQELRSYLGAVDESGHYYRWEHRIRADELAAIVRERLAHPDIDEVIEITPTSRGVSGRILAATMRVRMRDGAHEEVRINSQYQLRRLLHDSFLLSSAFLHRWEGAGSARTFVARGAGWGHGVGLCQIGAVGMALRGLDWQEILLHYFPGSTLERSY